MKIPDMVGLPLSRNTKATAQGAQQPLKCPTMQYTRATLQKNKVKEKQELSVQEAACSLPDTQAFPLDSNNNKTKAAHFGNVTVRYYEQTLGDHPDCEIGAPISLDWAYDNVHDEVPLDEYERSRACSRRPATRLRFSLVAKVALLMDCGVSEGEMKRAVRASKKAQKQRGRSNNSISFFGRSQRV